MPSYAQRPTHWHVRHPHLDFQVKAFGLNPEVFCSFYRCEKCKLIIRKVMLGSYIAEKLFVCFS